MNIASPAIIRVLPDPSEPGRFKWHLFGDDDKPLSPVIMSEATYATEEDARADGEAALAHYNSA